MTYAALVAAGRCPRCGGERLPEWGERIHCPTCLDEVAASDAERRARPGFYVERYAARRAATDARSACIDCGDPRDGDGIRCRSCTVDNSTAIMDRYDARKAAGVCPKCGGARDGDREWCGGCRKKRAARERAREARAA